MEGAPPSAQGPPPMRGGFRGRGGPPMRGFERGRGRGIGRGGPMGGRGGMGPPMRVRGIMRGGPPPRGFQRGPPRGMPMRNNRPPMHQQQNLTSPPTEPSGENSTNATSTSSTTNATTETNTVQTTNGSAGAPPSSRGGPRGRGGSARGRNAYVANTNGGLPHDSNKVSPMGKNYRGGAPRGRGGYSQGLSRPPPPHSANTQLAPAPSLKRGAPSGPPGPKRGRYDQAPVNRQLVPKHHSQIQSVHPAPHSGYANSFNHHSGYQGHDQMQAVDQYSQQAYAAPPQNSYNGYSQANYGTATSTGYSGGEYDQSQYQSYSAPSYGQDTRYQSYTQDYSQTYGTAGVDYAAPPPDYSQQAQAYDDRSYAGYDAQAYSQGYTNAAGYY